MKKRILCLTVTLCLLIGMLPMVTVFAAANTPAHFFFLDLERFNGYTAASSKPISGTVGNVVLNKGDAPVYYVSTPAEDGSGRYYLVKAAAGTIPTDNYAKFDYSGDVPVLTLKNVTVINEYGISFGTQFSDPTITYSSKYVKDYNLPLIVNVEGTNIIRPEHINVGCLDFYTLGDVKMQGGGSLELKNNRRGELTGEITSCGNLTIENVDINLEMSSDYGCPNAFCVHGADFVYDGGTLKILADASGYEAVRAFFYASSKTVGEETVGGNVTIQNGAKVIGLASIYYEHAIKASRSFTIKDSDVEFGVNRRTFSKYLLTAAPTFVFTNGYTATAATSTVSYTNTDFLTITQPSKTVDFSTVTNYNSVYYLNVTHNCAAEEDDGDPTTAVLCSICDKVLVEAEEPATPPAFDKVQVVAGNDLTLNYRISKAEVDAAGGTQVKIERATAAGAAEPKFVPLTEATVEDGFYVIPFTGIAAKEMGDEISMTVCNAEGEAVSVTRQDSILQYALRMLEGDDAKLKTLIVDMLNYGAMAQDVFDYNEENFVSAALTDEQKALGTQQMAACAANKATVTAAEGFTADVYQGTSFILNNNIAMAMRMSAELGDGSYAKVTFTNYLNKDQEEVTVNAQKLTDGTYAYIYNGLVAADGRCMVTWEFYKADHTKVATVEDSMEQYVGRNVEALPYLAQLMNYSDAAYAYFTAE